MQNTLQFGWAMAKAVAGRTNEGISREHESKHFYREPPVEGKMVPHCDEGKACQFHDLGPAEVSTAADISDLVGLF